MEVPIERVSVSGDVVARDKIVISAARNSGSGAWCTTPRQLPLDVSRFAGREDVLQKLDQFLQESIDKASPLIVAVTGMPGVGKSALVTHWAHSVAHKFEDGQIFIELNGYSSRRHLKPTEALGWVLRAIGVPPEHIPVHEAELVAMYRSQLAKRRMLIILDDAYGWRQVQLLLPGTAKCVVLATSRNDLADLVAYAGARAIKLDLLTQEGALDLVEAVIGSERMRAEPSSSIELVRLCGRLPLALRVASANLVAHSGQTIAELVKSLSGAGRLAELTFWCNLEEAVKNAFELSYRSLDPQSAAVFRLLGFIKVTDCSVNKVAESLDMRKGVARRLLKRLEAANLIQAGSPGCYRLHELLREYACERSFEEDDDGLRLLAFERYVQCYVMEVRGVSLSMARHNGNVGTDSRSSSAELGYQDAQECSAWLERELSNLLMIVRQALELDLHASALMLASELFRLLDVRCYYDANLSFCMAGLVGAEVCGDLAAQVLMHHHLAITYRRLGRYTESLFEAELGLSLGRHSGDGRLVACVHETIAHTYDALGHPRRALTYASRALEIWREMQDNCGEAEALALIGHLYVCTRKHSEALECIDDSLALSGSIVDRRSIGCLFVDRSTVLRRLNELDESEKDGRSALQLFKELGDRRGEAMALDGISRCLRRKGKLRDAYRYASMSLGISRAIGDRRGEATALNSLALIERRRGELKKAKDMAMRSINIRREIGDRRGEASGMDVLGKIYLEMAKTVMAKETAEVALAIEEEVGDWYGAGVTLRALAKISLELGRHDLAIDYLDRALLIERNMANTNGELKALRMRNRLISGSLGEGP